LVRAVIFSSSRSLFSFVRRPSLQVCYVWGVFALFFQSPTTVGLCVSSLSLAATMLFTHELRHRAHARNHLLAEAVDYLHEGSPLYRRVLDQCKWIATKNQLLNDTTLYISTKKNKLVRTRSGHGACSSRHGGSSFAPLLILSNHLVLFLAALSCLLFSLLSQATDIGIQTDALVPGSLNFVAQQSIIAHLHFIFDQQNWAATKQRYNELSARLPRMSCCGLRRSMTLEVEGVRLSRRDAFRLADELFLDGAAFYRRAELYNINMQQELVKAVEAIKYDRMVNIVAMLREQGNMAVTVEHLRYVSLEICAQLCTALHTSAVASCVASCAIALQNAPFQNAAFRARHVCSLGILAFAVCVARYVRAARSLHPLDPELLQYDSQVDAWTEKHARVLAEHARIRYDNCVACWAWLLRAQSPHFCLRVRCPCALR
jgi:hypothetical protein